MAKISDGYRIYVNYETGNTFGHRSTDTYVEHVWANKKVAEANLERIQQHYEWFAQTNRHRWRNEDEILKPDFVSKEYDFCLNLMADDGTEFSCLADWCGYFERLHYAEVQEVDG